MLNLRYIRKLGVNSVNICVFLICEAWSIQQTFIDKASPNQEQKPFLGRSEAAFSRPIGQCTVCKYIHLNQKT